MEKTQVFTAVLIFLMSSLVVTSQGKIDANDLQLTNFASHEKTGQSVYHFFIHSNYNNSEATLICNKFGGFLAHVKTQDVWQFIKDNIVIGGNNRDYYKDILWIGLHQIGENNSVWEWSDGIPLEGGINNQNWHKYWSDEPNDPKEKCAGTSTKRCRYTQTRCEADNTYVGQWVDVNCSEENKLVCENPFGSGFVSKETAVVGSTSDSINCTVFGENYYTAKWYRNGKYISTSSEEQIYQQHIVEHSKYRTSIITFVNPILESDEGIYVCSLGNVNTGISINITIQLETTSYISEPRLLASHDIAEGRNVTCTVSGRPIPTITWKIGDVNVERNDQIFQVFNTINETTLTSESVFSIINPISFEGNTQLSCVAEGSEVKTQDILINTEFTKVEESKTSYTFPGITTEPECDNVKGMFIEESGSCQFIAAEMMETEEEKCEGSELSIQIRDFTETATNYSLTVTEGGVVLTDQHITYRPSWDDGKIKIPNLKPETNYTVQLEYKPKYWSKSVGLTKTFQTTKAKIPEAMKITRANITSDSQCEVEFIPPSNNESSQLRSIMVNVTETSQNKENHKTYSISYVQGMNSFEFETKNIQSTYKFTTKLVTCAAECGVETEIFQCFRVTKPPSSSSTTTGTIIGVCVCGIVVIIILINCLWFHRKQKQRKSDDLDVSFLNRSGSIQISNIPDVTYENIQMEEVKATNPHEIKRNDLLERYQFLMSSEKRELHTQCQTMKKEIKANDKLTVSVSLLDKNRGKNRYKNITPYDETRVILSTDDGSSDYINASWINGYRQKKRFIAAQGPTPETVDDFWRMIYETDCKVIVMLTNLIEGGKRKCEQYWPERNSPYKSNNFTIKFINEDLAAAYTSRTFTIERNTSNVPKEFRMRRAVTQYQFICWPDHGVPDITSPILRFYNEVMEFANEATAIFKSNPVTQPTVIAANTTTPIVVHCSAGVGRTGTFISLDILKEMLNNEDYVDIYQTVFDLRLQRMDMVQTVDQFAFLHKLVLETHLLKNTDRTFEEFLKLRQDKQKFKKNLKKEFSNLSLIPITDTSQNLAHGRDLNNFNRDPSVLPYDRTRITSSLPNQLTDDVYFNGSMITNFRYGRKVISAQTPLPSTVEKFLNVIVEYSVSLVVMVSEKNQEGLYWADGDGASVQFGDFIVHNVSVTTEEIPGNSHKEEFSGARKFTITSPNQKIQKVQQIVIESWKDTDLSEEESRLLCSKLHKLVQQIDAVWNDNSTILIHCKDGSSFCGSLCALLQVNERLKMENKVDLFRVVKDLRDMRPHMVRTLGQYEVCHRVIEDLIQSLQTYENFR